MKKFRFRDLTYSQTKKIEYILLGFCIGTLSFLLIVIFCFSFLANL